MFGCCVNREKNRKEPGEYLNISYNVKWVSNHLLKIPGDEERSSAKVLKVSQ